MELKLEEMAREWAKEWLEGSGRLHYVDEIHAVAALILHHRAEGAASRDAEVAAQRSSAEKHYAESERLRELLDERDAEVERLRPLQSPALFAEVAALRQRVEELEREVEKQAALAEHRRQRIELLKMQPSVAICQEERAEGNGGCGACALCCKEQRERAEAAEAKLVEAQRAAAEDVRQLSIRIDVEIQGKIALRAEVRRLEGLILDWVPSNGSMAEVLGDLAAEARRIREGKPAAQPEEEKRG